MQSLGFENYCETLKVYLHKYRETLNSFTAMQHQHVQKNGMDGESEAGSIGGSSSGIVPPGRSVAELAAEQAGANALEQLHMAIQHGLQQQALAHAQAEAEIQGSGHAQAAQNQTQGPQGQQAQSQSQQPYMQYSNS